MTDAAPQDSQSPRKNAPSASPAVSRTVLHYVLIAATFLIIGLLIGIYGFEPDDSPVRLDETQLRAVMLAVLEESRSHSSAAAAADAAAERFALVDDDPYLGPADAPIVIVEFSDFFCSYCKRHFEQTFTPLLENYGAHIRYVYRDFARLTPESAPAAIAAQCAFEQGRFWEFHQHFFSHQDTLSRDFYLQTAEEFELDMDTYRACLDENRYLGEVEFDGLDGQIEGIRGTPGFFVNGQLVSGAQPYAVFERLIQRELDKAGIAYDLPPINAAG